MERYIKVNGYVCSACDSAFKADRVSQEPPLECPTCGSNAVEGAVVYECSQCGMMFPDAASVSDHWTNPEWKRDD